MQQTNRLVAAARGCPQRVLARAGWALAVLTLAAVLGGLPANGAGATPAVPKEAEPIVARCRADLAQRLKLRARDVTVAEVQARTWPNAALGLPKLGKMYAMQRTPGWRIVLAAREARYLYTASRRHFSYGGPLALWTGSMLYVRPVANEPDLNGDLYQCSLLGTNHTRLIPRVSEYYPQANGVVLFIRRTSRSSHELWFAGAGEGRDARRLHAALSFGEAALDESGNVWAAYVKPRVGADWTVVAGRIGQDDASKQTLPLPEGVRPQRIAWLRERLLALVARGEETACFAIRPFADAPEWEATVTVEFPGLPPFMLNKSETLEITQVGTEEKPSVEVARVWFTGDRKVLATIHGLTLVGHELVGAGYVLVWGVQDGKPAAYTVSVTTGEVFATFHGACQDIKAFQYPPVSGPLGTVRRPAAPGVSVRSR